MGARMEKSNRRIALIGFAILMVGLGISDSLRGIFSGIFQTHFALTAKGLSTIIAVSYAGNLCFLLAGGRIMDKIDRKKAFLGFLAVWMCAMLVFLLTDNYYALLVGMFLAMGASTLLNTSITLITPFIFATSPAMIVNVLFFTQGIGTSGGQSLIGNLADDFGGWKAVTGVLFAIGVLAFLIILKLQIPDSGEVKKAEKDQQGRKMKGNYLWIVMVVIFGVYFIAEHGMLNWFAIYGTLLLFFIHNTQGLDFIRLHSKAPSVLYTGHIRILHPGKILHAVTDCYLCIRSKWEVHMHFGTHSPSLIDTYDDAIAVLCCFHSICHHIFLCYLQH